LPFPAIPRGKKAKQKLFDFLDQFITERIVLSTRVAATKAAEKIDEGEVILTFGRSSLVEAAILCALEAGKRFRVVVVDSRPNFEGKELLRRLVSKQVSCTYILINAVSYIMKEVKFPSSFLQGGCIRRLRGVYGLTFSELAIMQVTKVLVGAASVLHNGNVMARCGTALVCMAAHAEGRPVLVACETYKFSDRALLDSVGFNEIGKFMCFSCT
jgi:translation initiation factor eIF-2B subunit delta